MKIIISAIVSLMACEDVFDKQPLDTISENDVWNDEVLISAYVTDLYSRFPSYTFQQNWHNYTDEATHATGNGSAITQGTVNRSNEGGTGYWDYEFIRDCNLFLEKINETPIDDAVKKQLEGEVRFLRAYAYFQMQKRYGGVPLVDASLDPFNEIDQTYTKRATEEAIADFIESELNTAINLLTDNANPKGRINKWIATALKARVMLWNASIADHGTVQLNGLVGIPESRASEFYDKAAQAANAVINSGKYSLYNKISDDKAENYRKLFLDEGNDEVIFEVAYDGVNKGHSWDMWNGPNTFASRGGSLDPTLEFILAYENIDGSETQPEFGPDHLYNDGYEPFQNKDPRLKATVFFQGDTWIGSTIQTYEGLDPSITPDPSAVIRNPNESYQGVPTVGLDSRSLTKDDFSTNSGFHVKKYFDDSGVKIPGGQSKTNFIIFRLAEMYLIKAEAEFEMGNLQEAADALNQTRKRAGISLVDENTITRDKVRRERRSELAFENHRYWDLRRWRTAESILNHRFQGLQIIYHYESGKYYFLPFDAESFTRAFKTEHYYNPITTSRIDNNPDLVENFIIAGNV